MNSDFYKIGHIEDCLIEECSELIQAICKAKRFGLDNWHPVTKVKNRDQIMLEIMDVESRLKQYKNEILVTENEGER
jgi:hypothetical protein